MLVARSTLEHPGAGAERFPLGLAPKRQLEDLGNEPTPATPPGQPVNPLDEIAREQEVCAHSHAHIIAHSTTFVNQWPDMRPSATMTP